MFHVLGIPSTSLSLALYDYFPTLCTHRPSLLSIERFSELSSHSIRIAIVVEVEGICSEEKQKSYEGFGS